MLLVVLYVILAILQYHFKKTKSKFIILKNQLKLYIFILFHKVYFKKFIVSLCNWLVLYSIKGHFYGHKNVDAFV